MHSIASPVVTKFLILLVLFGAYGSTVLRAQVSSVAGRGPGSEQDFQFERFTQADGLSADGPYRSIVQDRQGFLWLGTDTGGLVRYDGFKFDAFRHNPEDSTSISSNAVQYLYVDLDGILWVGTIGGGGINKYDAATETFVRYLPGEHVRAIIQTRDRSFWVATQGLVRFDPATETVVRYLHNPGDERSLSHDRVEALYEDQDGVLWIGTEEGLNRYDRASDDFTQLWIDETTSSAENDVTAFAEDSRGALYVGTCPGRLYRFDRVAERLEPFLAEDRDPHNTEERCTSVKYIHEDLEGILWFNMMGKGLSRYDPATQTVSQYRHEPADPTSLSSDETTSIYEDHQGVRWIGTFGKGVNKAIASSARFRLYGRDEIRASNGVQSLHEDDTGLLWIGTNTGQLFRFDPATEALERFSPPQPTSDGLWGRSIRAILKDQNGILWVGQSDGIYQVDLEAKTHAEFRNSNGRSLNWPTFIKEDKLGRVWIGAYFRGLHRYDPKSGETARFVYDPADEKSLIHTRLTAMYQDRQGVLWFGTEDGRLNRFDEDTESFTTYLDGSSIASIFEDRAGRFWVGTDSDGLYLFDRSSGESIQYTLEDGLPNDIVKEIVEDRDGTLWLNTPGGLARFNPETDSFTYYNEDDGLNNYSAGNNLTLLSREGVLYIGGTNGLTAIDLDKFTLNLYPPNSVIRRLRVNDQDRSLMGIGDEPIELAHDENELTFDYVGLHFANPLRNQYRYRLDGYDSDWREAGTVRTATYTNLRPGRYTFNVKASNSDGVWNEDSTSLVIRILPPWWRTLWAYGLYGILFVGAVLMADRAQRRRLIAKERERTRERELGQAREIETAYHQLKTTQTQLIQAEKMASLGELTAGIAHEIKNPLNFINNFAEVNEELADELREACDDNPNIKLAEVLDVLADLKQNASVIAENGKRADSIVQTMMQHASGGSGQREPTDLNGLVAEHIDLAYHGKRAQEQDFMVEINRDFDDDAGTVELVSQEIGRVLLNLLGNAFDAVHEHAANVNDTYRPIVTVSTRRIDDGIEIRVQDNGPGIGPEIRAKIFEPFFTTKPTGSGTGLGLSLSYDIVTQGHGGTLRVESDEGQGATFIVALPENR